MVKVCIFGLLLLIINDLFMWGGCFKLSLCFFWLVKLLVNVMVMVIGDVFFEIEILKGWWVLVYCFVGCLLFVN